ncbi:hypothetical protein Tco_0457794 [Tanacetum coccineum]
MSIRFHQPDGVKAKSGTILVIPFRGKLKEFLQWLGLSNLPEYIGFSSTMVDAKNGLRKQITQRKDRLQES